MYKQHNNFSVLDDDEYCQYEHKYHHNPLPSNTVYDDNSCIDDDDKVTIIDLQFTMYTVNCKCLLNDCDDDGNDNSVTIF